jgi:hypothetical protein
MAMILTLRKRIDRQRGPHPVAHWQDGRRLSYLTCLAQRVVDSICNYRKQDARWSVRLRSALFPVPDSWPARTRTVQRIPID